MAPCHFEIGTMQKYDYTGNIKDRIFLYFSLTFRVREKLVLKAELPGKFNC